MSKLHINLYLEHVADLKSTIQLACSNNYSSITSPLVNPLFYREFDIEPVKNNHLRFSRSDLILKSSEWLNLVIAKVNDTIDCDADNEETRKHSEKTLIQEISFAEHVIQHGYLLVKLKGPKNANLAKTISGFTKCTYLLEIPMVDPEKTKLSWRNDVNEDDSENVGTDTWTWWNNFRYFSDFNSKHKIALVLSADLPSKEELLRWLGEPIDYLIVPSSLYLSNHYNNAVLSKRHQEVIAAFMQNNVQFMVKASPGDKRLFEYSDYLKHLWEKFRYIDPIPGFDDLLEIPLQPLFDNLDAYTYEIFEKDPTKYLYYQKAIESALVDKIPEVDKSTKKAIIMVVGAGRGPLVRAALNAAKNVDRLIKIYVIEKNPNAIITLSAVLEELWTDKDIKIISCDMRDFDPPEKADIIVSELLGSFGDNELSPECLDGAQKHLKEDGISIPCKSTSYINPTMSTKIYNQVRMISKSTHMRDKTHSYTTSAECPYVVYLKNAYHIADPQPLFEFVHPNRSNVIDNNRFKTLKFQVKVDCVMHGFSGYFDSILYKDVTLSIHPATHSKGLASWFPMFFPFVEPQELKAGDIIEINFWRCVASHRVWYEWSTSGPHKTHIHNLKGRSSDILM